MRYIRHAAPVFGKDGCGTRVVAGIIGDGGTSRRVNGRHAQDGQRWESSLVAVVDDEHKNAYNTASVRRNDLRGTRPRTELKRRLSQLQSPAHRQLRKDSGSLV